MSFTITTTTLNFELKREIGQEGRNSQVFLAHDKQLDAEIVIKKIPKAKIVDQTEFYGEAKRLYDSEHQHVVPIKYACEDADYIYLAMPFYPKGSLRQLINTRFLTVREIIRYATQFLSGLHNIHVKKLIHFDIKPDNILLSNANEALVSDFGLSKNMNSLGLSGIGLVYPKQMPPELFTQTDHSMLYDIYLAGVTLYRLCNGNSHYDAQFGSFPDENAYIDAIIKGIFPDRKGYYAHIPNSLRRFINQSISVDQSKRQQTVLELLNDLSTINELLDWQFSINGPEYRWVLDNDLKTVEVTLLSDNNNFHLTTFKTVKASNRRTKVNAGCITNIQQDQIDKIIQSVLKDNE